MKRLTFPRDAGRVLDDATCPSDPLTVVMAGRLGKASDRLRCGWLTQPTPSDRAMQKAVKWVFGQGWTFEIATHDPLRASIKRCFRFEPHMTGRHLETEADLARTAVIRAVDDLVSNTVCQGGLLARLHLAETPADELRTLNSCRDDLRRLLLTAVENTGFDGLCRHVDAAQTENHDILETLLHAPSY